MWRWMVLLPAVAAWLTWSDAFGWRWLGAGLLCATAMVALGRAGLHIQRRRRVRAVDGLRELSPGEFETEVARWFRREGYHVDQRGGTGDGGVDLVARRGAEVLAVQCKRYAADAAVSAAQVRDLYGAAVAEGTDRAVLVTTGRVSKAARAWVEALPDGPSVTVFDAGAVSEFARGNTRPLRG